MTVTVPGYSTVSSRPLAIVSLLRESAYIGKPGRTIDEYIASVQDYAESIFGVHLNISGNTMEVRAESLLREMNRFEFVIIEEESQ